MSPKTQPSPRSLHRHRPKNTNTQVWDKFDFNNVYRRWLHGCRWRYVFGWTAARWPFRRTEPTAARVPSLPTLTRPVAPRHCETIFHPAQMILQTTPHSLNKCFHVQTLLFLINIIITNNIYKYPHTHTHNIKRNIEKILFLSTILTIIIVFS